MKKPTAADHAQGKLIVSIVLGEPVIFRPRGFASGAGGWDIRAARLEAAGLATALDGRLRVTTRGLLQAIERVRYEAACGFPGASERVTAVERIIAWHLIADEPVREQDSAGARVYTSIYPEDESL